MNVSPQNVCFFNAQSTSLGSIFSKGLSSASDMTETSSHVRLFLGTPIPEDYLAPIRALNSTWKNPAWIRWVPEEQLHVTTLFIGEVRREILENLVAMFTEGFSTCVPFELTGAQWRWGPPGQPPRMLWIQFSKSPAFTELVQKQQHWLSQVHKMPQQRKAPIPHITVGRTKPRENDPVINLPGPILLEPMQLEKIVLWQSVLLPQRAMYQPLRSFSLRGSGSK